MSESSDRGEIDRLSDRKPGEDEEDPYADVDIRSLPRWWQEAIEEHRAYDLRPYRPPRFEDDVIYPQAKLELQEELGADIMLVCYDIAEANWEILVDGTRVGEVERERLPEGYSLIKMSSQQFEDVIRESVA